MIEMDVSTDFVLKKKSDVFAFNNSQKLFNLMDFFFYKLELIKNFRR